jgi:hypothetical protein
MYIGVRTALSDRVYQRVSLAYFTSQCIMQVIIRLYVNSGIINADDLLCLASIYARRVWLRKSKTLVFRRILIA